MYMNQKVISVVSRMDRLLIRILRPNVLVLLVVETSIFCFLIVGWIFNFPVNFNIYSSIGFFILAPTSAILVLMAASLVSLFNHRPAKPSAFLNAKLWQEWNVANRILQGAPIFFCFPALFSAFTSYKLAISKIVSFYADPYALALDRAIHGTDPWRLLQPIFGFPMATEVLNIFYNLWFFIMFMVLSFGIFMIENQRLRSQYLTAFILSWVIIGGVFATIFSSVGPCFYLSFYQTNAYADLFAYLDRVDALYPLWSRDLQDMIITQFQKGGLGIGEGISAMPSMHVGIAVLNAIFITKLNRIAGWIAWIFAALIFVGSVHLGWHYAVDGYAAALLVGVIWFISGKLAEKFEPLDRMLFK